MPSAGSGFVFVWSAQTRRPILNSTYLPDYVEGGGICERSSALLVPSAGSGIYFCDARVRRAVVVAVVSPCLRVGVAARCQRRWRVACPSVCRVLCRASFDARRVTAGSPALQFVAMPASPLHLVSRPRRPSSSCCPRSPIPVVVVRRRRRAVAVAFAVLLARSSVAFAAVVGPARILQ